MTSLVIVIFILGYLTITLEHPLKLDKAVPALLMGTLMWAILSIGFNYGWFNIVNHHGKVFSLMDGESAADSSGFNNNLMRHFSSIGEILFFLIGAMTIVEIIDLHRGFGIIKRVIKPKSKVKLLWIFGILAFLLSAVIDNLTATIILITLLRKIISRKQYRLWFAGLIIVAANAGGAWSPIGDVTTTMLWIGDKVTAVGLSEYVIIPSIICFVVPFAIASRMKPFRGKAIRKELIVNEEVERLLSSKTMLYVGLGAIIFVPIFKAITGLPPYLGMMFSLGTVWLVSEYVRPEKNLSKNLKYQYSANVALSKIEFSSILFFLGILLGVAALESMVFGSISGNEVGTLRYAAESISNTIPNMDVVIMLIGVLSAVIDNVPMVAATMGMYSHGIDDSIWHFIAFSAGTGGSLLIIGSAAGVAAMGIEKIDFIWYLKKISWLALVGFLSGSAVFILMEKFLYD